MTSRKTRCWTMYVDALDDQRWTMVDGRWSTMVHIEPYRQIGCSIGLNPIVFGVTIVSDDDDFLRASSSLQRFQEPIVIVMTMTIVMTISSRPGRRNDLEEEK